MAIRPSAASSLVLGLLLASFLWLGQWQMQRAAWKQDRQARYAAAPVVSDLESPLARETYSRLRIAGRFDSERHVLMDNRIHQGRPGVHVLSPFTTDAGRTLLVNRGWLPMSADRQSLPAVPVYEKILEVDGHLEPLRVAGMALGAPDQMQTGTWPQLVTYPALDTIAAALDTELHPLVLYLAPESAGGFAGRDWNPFPMGPEKHRGYALQWFILAGACLIAWVILGRQRAQRSSS